MTEVLVNGVNLLKSLGNVLLKGRTAATVLRTLSPSAAKNPRVL
jgi:hypothetical protein